jgi:hypothetical protein
MSLFWGSFLGLGIPNDINHGSPVWLRIHNIIIYGSSMGLRIPNVIIYESPVDLEFLMSLFMRAQGIWKSRCHYL